MKSNKSRPAKAIIQKPAEKLKPAMRPIIQLSGVWKTYEIGENKVHALRGIDLSVHDQEFVAIQGPSGSGKSLPVNMRLSGWRRISLRSRSRA